MPTEAIRTALEALTKTRAALKDVVLWVQGGPRGRASRTTARLAVDACDAAIATLTAELERPASQWPLKPLEKVQVYLPDSEIQAVCRPAFAYFDSRAMGELEDRLKAPPAERPAPEPVAWRYTDSRGHYRYCGWKPGFDKEYPMLKPEPLYAAPPAKDQT